MNADLKVTLDPAKLSMLMAEKGLTLTELAEIAGKSRPTVTYWINARMLTPKQANLLAKALEVEVKDLI